MVSVLIVACLTGYRYVNAQESDFNLVTSPLPVSLVVEPGKSVTTDLKLKNASSRSIKLKVLLMKFKVNPQGVVELLEKSDGDNYFNWVTFSPQIFNAEPNEWINVKMSINVPKEAALGYYYAVNFVKADQTVASTKGATLEGRVVTFVLLDVVSKNAKRQASIVSFEADKKWYEYLPAKLTVVVKNTGNIHNAPSGNIFITRAGKTVSMLNVNQYKGNILPNSIRSFSTDWDQGFPTYVTKEENDKVVLDDKQTPKQSLKWDFAQTQKFRIGRYTAKIVLAYNDGQRDIPLRGEVSFWVFPWKLMALTLVVFILVSIGVVSILKNIFKKIKNRRQKKII